ncbi:MAG TPA: prephenate dehydrogenase/arogenate dehydrogenase family protein [Mycobacteriales bacterium]|nr:prephenate dehydrogenase/arogenate dehydrogenase family protein [Mycobacteriales bacterium]
MSSRAGVPGTAAGSVEFRRVAVIGLGLIGGSLLRRLAGPRPPDTGAVGPDGAVCETVGYDRDPGTRDAASAAGHTVAPTLADAVGGQGGADLVVVATPLRALPGVLADLAVALRPDAVLTDVASVKVAARDAVRAANLLGTYVGGHPMAGTERSGFDASDPGLFDGAAWVLCLDGGTDLVGWLALARLVTAIGCRVVPAGAAEHDAAAARISGLPHVLAAVLAATAGTTGLAPALAAGSYRDGTRVAGTRPDLAAALCDGNRIAVADTLDEALDRLTAARDTLRAGGSVLPLCSEGYAARRRWEPGGVRGEWFELDAGDPDLRDRLRALGAGGGHVRSVSGRALRCWRPAGL